MRKIEVEEESKKRRIGGIGNGRERSMGRRMGEKGGFEDEEVGGEEGYLR